jgi:pimeloyl-ACP methyl ester carboxylesterase
VEVDVRDGFRLEALLSLPESPRGALVICHPHPLYGGDMHNPVVVRVAEVAQGLGLATLRFNFRGVGISGGVHGGGEGEQDDVTAALKLLAGRLPADRPTGLAGYSFGGWVSARVAAAMPALPALALVAPPSRAVRSGFFGARTGAHAASGGQSRPILSGGGDRTGGEATRVPSGDHRRRAALLPGPALPAQRGRGTMDPGVGHLGMWKSPQAAQNGPDARRRPALRVERPRGRETRAE